MEFKDLFRKTNNRSEFSRTCIAEAVIALLKERSLKDIHVTQVVKKAGVSRMTFYNNYHSVEEVLKDYLQILIAKYAEEGKKHPEIGRFREYNHILFSLEFFDNYRDYFVVMKENGLYNIVLDAVNEFMEENGIDKGMRYKMYYYAGGLFNIFMAWVSEGENRTKSTEIARVVSEFFA